MVKPKTISLDSVRLNTVALNHYGNISGGGSKPDPIAAWIRKHMAFRYDTKGYTNEVLSQTKQLQDLSGNNRPMLLNNFLFAEMSGIGGYNDNFKNWEIRPVIGTVDRISSEQVIIRKINQKGEGVIQANLNNKHVFLKCNIEEITEELKGKIRLRYHTEAGYRDKILENGYFEFDSNIETDNSGFAGFVSTEPIDNCNITITQIPEYPGALVTDGVDDYGAVQNMAHGVKMLFMTVNPIGDNWNKSYYSQNTMGRPFWIYVGTPIAYNGSTNPGGVTYINGALNESINYKELSNIKHTITIVNNTYDSSVANITPIFFANEHYSAYISKLAFYNSIGFDSIPTEEDGFTEQELIDYVIEKYELNKI